MMERSKLDKEALTMESIGVVDVTNGVITYKKIIHKPRIFENGRDSERRSTCYETRGKSGNLLHD